MSKDPTKTNDEHVSTSQALDDEQRVKVLSPGQLVAKRFFRNRLAMVGLIILIVMFLFSFVGGMVSPYGESQVFRKQETTWKDYAGASYNDAYIFRTKEGMELPAAAQQKFILAVNKELDSFEAAGKTYGLEKLGDDFWVVSTEEPIATVLTLKGKSAYTESSSIPLTDEIKEGYEKAVAAGENRFEADGTEYSISKAGRQNQISVGGEIAVATKKIFNAASEDTAFSFELYKLSTITTS